MARLIYRLKVKLIDRQINGQIGGIDFGLLTYETETQIDKNTQIDNQIKIYLKLKRGLAYQ